MHTYYLFSRNKKIGSKLISWASSLLLKGKLEKVPSHIALLINDKLVIESVLDSGVRIVPYSCWLEINEECYKIPGEKIDPHYLFSELGNFWGKGYDYKAIIYFAVSFFRNVLFGTDIPKENVWQDNNKYMCVELVAKISGYKNYTMVTPAKICLDLLNGKTS